MMVASGAVGGRGSHVTGDTGRGGGGRKGHAVAPLSQVHSGLKKAQQKARLSFRLCVHPQALCQGQEGELRPRGVEGQDGSPSSLAPPPYSPTGPCIGTSQSPSGCLAACRCHRLADQWGFQWGQEGVKVTLQKAWSSFCINQAQGAEGQTRPG